MIQKLQGFLKMRFPSEIKYGMIAGPSFNNTKTIGNNGKTVSIITQRDSLHKYQVQDADQTDERNRILKAFYMQTYGGGYGFLFKDWSDYDTRRYEGVANDEGFTFGNNTFQLYKKYAFDNNLPAHYRVIEKPIVSTLRFYVNDEEVADWTTDEDTGIVTMLPIKSKSISAITKATNASVTCVAHGFILGDKVRFKEIAGMTVLNNKIFTVTVIDSNTFTINFNTTNASDFINDSKAKAEIFAGSKESDVIEWEGEFDVPVMFAEDYAPIVISGYNQKTFEPALVEIRTGNI